MFRQENLPMFWLPCAQRAWNRIQGEGGRESFSSELLCAALREGLCSICPVKLCFCQEIKSCAWLPAPRPSPSNKWAAALGFCASLVLGWYRDTPRRLFRITSEGRFWLPFGWKSKLTSSGWWMLAGHGAVQKNLWVRTTIHLWMSRNSKELPKNPTLRKPGAFSCLLSPSLPNLNKHRQFINTARLDG